MKPYAMTAEVAAMLDVRRSAEQRGNYEGLGRLQWLKTAHGLIYFPADSQTGEGCGPDLAWTDTGGEVDLRKNSAPPPPDFALLVLGAWEGLPSLRVNSSKPCPKCRHLCDVCGGEGVKLCELCGGAGWTPGPFVPCDGAGCRQETGKFKADCAVCGGRGEMTPHLPCSMCSTKNADGFTLMTCSRCQGTGKYSTGRVNGAIDWDIAPKCKACDGTTFRGKWVRQDVKKFRNAILGKFVVLGPIAQFAIRDPRSSGTRLFDVGPDAAGDLLVLLVPRSLEAPRKAYLVGGVVHERVARNRTA